MIAVKFEKVRFSYEDDETAAGEDLFSPEPSFALQDIDFIVEEGEFVAVLGHNGSGKSTLARLIDGLLTPASGKITVLGLDAGDPQNLFDIRKQVGIVFQNPDNQMVASIVEDDVAFGPENVGIKREEIGERISFALAGVGMEEFRHSTPSRLSGGQKQRIAIAGVLALKPKIMILDESTAMLDPRGRKEVMDVVLRLNREENITVILITHFPEEALLADRAIVMNKGEIVLQGKPDEVLKRGDELETYALTLPRPIRICRKLTEGGLAVVDGMDADTVAKNILSALENPSKILVNQMKTAGAGTSLPASDGEEGRVACENLTYVYNPSSPFETYALKGVDLEIQSGEFFGIIGRTGSGKSTFAQHLNALIKVPSAQKKYKPKRVKKGAAIEKPVVLRVDGFDLTDKRTDFKALRSKVGMVFQYPEYQLFADTVFEDVAFGLKNFNPDLSDEETAVAVKEALEIVGLNYEEIKNRSPFELSGGQKRRVAIAGVIVSKPEILVLDEPAAGLDPLGKEEIMSLLHKLHKEWCKTVVFISHDMDEIAENCTSAAVFSEGKILATANPKNLFSQTDTIRAAGLDVPFTAQVAEKLRDAGVEIVCDFTLSDFVEKVLLFAKSKGAGTSLTAEGGRENG